VISRGAEVLQGICQWNEDDSWRKLTAGRGLELVTETERISSTVPENKGVSTIKEAEESQLNTQ
jgi:hypothetical protein